MDTKTLICIGICVVVGVALYWLYQKYKKCPKVVCPICPLTPGCPQGNESMMTTCVVPFASYIALINSNIGMLYGAFSTATSSVQNIRKDPLFIAIQSLAISANNMAESTQGKLNSDTITFCVKDFDLKAQAFADVTPGADVAAILKKDGSLSYMLQEFTDVNSYSSLKNMWNM